MSKKKQTELEDFLNKHEIKQNDFEEVETINFDRDTLYKVTVNSYHEFDGKFGKAVVVNYQNGETTAKAYLGGYEVNHFVNFMNGKELPLDVQLARTQRESAENEGRVFNRLVIAEL